MKAAKTRSSLATLAQLYAGNRCPHETECACRTSDWCPKAGDRTDDEDPDYPMLHLAGCTMGYERCCCRVLDEIESLTDELLLEAGVHAPPVPIDVIRLCDPNRPIELRPLPLKAYFGCAWSLGNEWVVHLNSNNSPEVSRFTAFHEGFHIACSSSGLSFSKAGECYQPLSERLADYFAASLIMPRKFVREVWPNADGMAEMARLFEAPAPMMTEWVGRLRLGEALPPCET